MKKTLSKHFLHEHTLELNDKAEEKCKGKCRVCREPITDWQYYRCSKCPDIRIHTHSCSQIPLQFDHHPFQPHPHHTLYLSDKLLPSHFCYACGGNCYGRDFFIYRCLASDFALHVKCALLTPTPTAIATKNNHHNKKIQFQFQHQNDQPNHPHPFILCHKDQNLIYKCTCCDLVINEDCVYVCLQCKGLLHNSCLELPWEIKHPFHSSHPLVLRSRPGSYDREFICSVCCQRRHGFAYHCFKCKFVVDVHCACLIPEHGHTHIEQFKHSHPLFLCHNNNKNENLIHSYTCYACWRPLNDSIYFCPECCALLHESCANLPPEIEHLLHPHHTLTLHYHHRHSQVNTRNLKCGVCLSDCHGFFYECSHCEWYMDVRCAFLSKPTIMSRSKIHHHPLALIFAETARVGCKTCAKFCPHSPLFRCVWCNFSHHVHCISALPPTLKYNNHIHRLTFTNSPIKDHQDEDDEAELYCDACEKRRDLPQATYYCEKCHYVAHPHCVVSEIIHILEEKWSKHENVEEPPALTLKEFLDSFSEDENKEVKGVFEAYRRDVRGKTGIFKNIENSELRRSTHLDKVSARVMKKLIFEVDVAMPWENWDSTSKVIKDGNYMILENQVSILKVLFSKYGDFSNRSRLSTKAIMLFIMTVCEAVYNMCNTKVVDITTSLLLTWFHSFALAQYANFEIMFVIARLTKLVRAHFGLQADHDVPVDLNLAGLSVQIAKQLAVIDSKALAIVKQDGETDDLRKKVDSMQLTISKLDEAIQELENNKQAIEKKKQALGKKKQKHALEKEKEALEKNKKALLKTLEEKCVRKECLIDALELEGQMAGTSLL
ncbi:uncharacterized protein LOC114260454 isoform X1 [Camellia sinensis]|uniref:uncharacterized protein LOC114260454 isoform X1 n=1 Tax=Camellia sinensis TaxID=4442 RepID=UPI001036EFDC|nr:uncharacterized protein LOC114260454 isoform X1 [Camellia sinensis]XP_028056384.1 uncharacterized protein LOC114260454 isoform X1 [Camellia sinensis]XP_028056386.1 uncharacterized protein LOC114260454 isoform X2 [Camellia sinensis]XP_028056387.1 uncharacterized protein LOC114260454 isoform X1 [Camellia sinensis]XP_028056388.1 uncharacterized protein LOC114260454 isoform X1 [Camellia sinensis]XP_028056389.1 uncharacterized protein LOC114260454 isoform X3 [Camellia sinensis]XP_028056390.1 un